MILFTIASKQIWPQVLSILHLKPEQVYLFHSEDKSESLQPAQRLKRFFDDSNIVQKGNTKMCKIPHDDFLAVETMLEEVRSKNNLSCDSLVLNFTGGNKLMATAAFRWAVKYFIKSFYLEKGNKIFWFEPKNEEVITNLENLNPHIADELDPVEILRCQLETSDIERKGEIIQLTKEGIDIPSEKMFRIIENGSFQKEWINRIEPIEDEDKEGDNLEFQTAAVLLKLGVRKLRRSTRLKSKGEDKVSIKNPHSEIDLLFVWNGKLWTVDCKDTIGEEEICSNFYKEIRNMPGRAKVLWNRIRDIVENRPYIQLKVDIATVREVGGLYGSVIWVRKKGLNDEIKQFARRNSVYLVNKRTIASELAEILKR